MRRNVRSWVAGALRGRAGVGGPWNQRGDTLVSALVAFAIAAIVIGAAAPNFVVMYDTYSLHGAARRVVGDLRKARIQAATENNRYAVELVDAHSYTIHDDDDGDGVAGAGERVDTINLSAAWPTITVSFSGTIVFFANASTAGARTVGLESRSGETRRVSVSRAGRVRIEAPAAAEES